MALFLRASSFPLWQGKNGRSGPEMGSSCSNAEELFWVTSFYNLIQPQDFVTVDKPQCLYNFLRPS